MKMKLFLLLSVLIASQFVEAASKQRNHPNAINARQLRLQGQQFHDPALVAAADMVRKKRDAKVQRRVEAESVAQKQAIEAKAQRQARWMLNDYLQTEQHKRTRQIEEQQKQIGLWQIPIAKKAVKNSAGQESLHDANNDQSVTQPEKQNADIIDRSNNASFQIEAEVRALTNAEEINKVQAQSETHDVPLELTVHDVVPVASVKSSESALPSEAEELKHDTQVPVVVIVPQLDTQIERNAREIARMQDQWRTQAVLHQARGMKNAIQPEFTADNVLPKPTILQSDIDISFSELKSEDMKNGIQPESTADNDSIILELPAEFLKNLVDDTQADTRASKLLHTDSDEMSKNSIADQDQFSDNVVAVPAVDEQSGVSLNGAFPALTTESSIVAIAVSNLADKQAELNAAQKAKEQLEYDLIVNGFTVNNEGQPYPANMPTRWQRAKIYVAAHPYKTGMAVVVVSGLTAAGVVAYKKGYLEKLKNCWQNFKFKNPFAKAEVKPIKKKKNTKKRK